MEITDSTLETVEMSEIDGTELGAVIRYISLPKGGMTHEAMALHTCMDGLAALVQKQRHKKTDKMNMEEI